MESPLARTRIFARILGPYLTITALIAAIRDPHMQTMLSDFQASSLWSWVAGGFALLLGLTIVALHNSWANPPAAIISALGWLIALRGVLLMAFPSAFEEAASAMMGSGPVWRIAYVGLAAVGLYLAVVGWRPHRRPTAPETLV